MGYQYNQRVKKLREKQKKALEKPVEVVKKKKRGRPKKKTSDG